MLIRPVRPTDFDAIARMVNPYITSSHVHFGTEMVTGDALRDEWERVHAQYAFVVGCDEADPRELHGFARTSAWRTRAAYAWTAEVGVYVAPERHRRGVARALYGALIGASRRQGYHALVAGIALPNDPSVRLHEALGFEPVGVFREAGSKLGRAIDVGFWQLLLDSHTGAREPVRAATYDAL